MRRREEPPDLTPYEKYESEIRMQLGGRLTTIRKQHQQSEATLAERLSMQTSEIEDLEAGVGTLPIDAYMRVFFYLGHGFHCQVRGLEQAWAKKRKQGQEARRLQKEEYSLAIAGQSDPAA